MRERSSLTARRSMYLCDLCLSCWASSTPAQAHCATGVALLRARPAVSPLRSRCVCRVGIHSSRSGSALVLSDPRRPSRRHPSPMRPSHLRSATASSVWQTAAARPRVSQLVCVCGLGSGWAGGGVSVWALGDFTKSKLQRWYVVGTEGRTSIEMWCSRALSVYI